MLQSSATDVDAYLAEVSDDRKVLLTRLRELCRAELTGFTEVMAYRMPAYERDGVAEIAFASQKQYISFCLMRGDVQDAFAERLVEAKTWARAASGSVSPSASTSISSATCCGPPPCPRPGLLAAPPPTAHVPRVTGAPRPTELCAI